MAEKGPAAPSPFLSGGERAPSPFFLAARIGRSPEQRRHARICETAEGGRVANEQPLAIGFGDLRGFTSYTAERGDREALRVAERFASVVRAELEEHGGRLLKTYGDGVMMSFDDSSSAVRSVADAQRALSELQRSAPRRVALRGVRPHVGSGHPDGRRPLRPLGEPGEASGRRRQGLPNRGLV